jgi:hypothetical protein
MAPEFLTKTITVRGETVTVYSLDAWRWSSSRDEILECEERRARLVGELARSLKKSG